ncbi:MAG: hypothetical protein JWP09_443 [Candidatus Taylorbacteria bacterium]|nr:hypothetical protein [Candidatus Taylorbacteria bacterium]
MRKIILTIIITALVSVTLTMSILRTTWTNYQINLSDWWSIVSTIINIILVCFSIWQYLEAENQKKKTKSQVKIWMQDAKGIVAALNKVQGIHHTKISDMCNSISMVEAFANSLYQSLYEERVVKEEDYQETEKKKSDIVTEQEIQQLKNRASLVEPNAVSSSKPVFSNRANFEE